MKSGRKILIVLGVLIAILLIFYTYRDFNSGLAEEHHSRVSVPSLKIIFK